MGLPITILIAARNEEKNLARCLSVANRVERVIVVDSDSTDRTAEIASQHGAEVVAFSHAGGYPKKRQWALDTLEIRTPWVLFLDADEFIPSKLWDEIRSAITAEFPKDGYLIRKGFHFLGRRMRHGGFSHRAVLLVRYGKARFERLIEVPGDTLDMEVHERVIVDGPVGELPTPLIHEDFKGLEAYIDKHNRYSTWESHLRYQLLTTGRYGEDTVEPRLWGNEQERRRWLKKLAVRLPLEPWLWFIYHYVWRLGCLEGRPGLIACQIRRQYIANVRAKVWERIQSSGE
ncbi:glycosyltransferase family 2 protein [Stieleria neptunia]|uniref:glycosyltransferase family 2 protein n=1 Tax=Stieleria neptunia TaxID=2527979 RepID=UPI0011A3C69A|nr:glycosyltransferase family 2 protein [Stieleria neptunia]